MTASSQFDGQALDDTKRLEDLEESGISEYKADPTFNRFTKLAAGLLDVPVSLVSILKENKQQFIGCTGLAPPYSDHCETPLSHSFCQYVVIEGEALVISDAREDLRLKSNKAILDLGVVSYLGIPIVTANGNVLGSFCAIDSEPREWTSKEIELMREICSSVISEIELRRTNRVLSNTVNELNKAHVLHDELMHMIIHDLRAPLIGIFGSLEILSEGIELSPDNEELLAMAKSSCGTMTDLVNSILDTNKLKSGDVPVRMEQTELLELFGDVLSQCSLNAKTRYITLQSQFDHCPTYWVTDTRLLQRIVLNLLGNALKFTPSGGHVTLSVSVHPAIQDWLMIKVVDDGPGVPKEEQDMIFDKFVTGKSNQQQIRSNSTGMGLAFCKLATDSLGGLISVTSANDQGCVFTLELPKGELTHCN